MRWGAYRAFWCPGWREQIDRRPVAIAVAVKAPLSIQGMEGIEGRGEECT